MYLFVKVGKVTSFQFAGFVHVVDGFTLRPLLLRFPVRFLLGLTNAVLVVVFFTFFVVLFVIVAFLLEIVIVEINSENILSFLQGPVLFPHILDQYYYYYQSTN